MAGAHDCGPERSLRTSPSSSSLPPFGGCLRIPSGASRLPAIGSARPRGYGFRGSLRCWTCVQGVRPAGLPIAAARAATLGVCAFERVAGALRAVGGRFSIDSARRGGGAVVVGAMCAVLRVTSFARRPQTVLVRACTQWQRVLAQVGLGSNALRRWHAFNEKSFAAAASLPKKMISPFPHAIAPSRIARYRVSLKRPRARPA